MSVEDAQTTRHAGERKSLWGYLGVHTPIRGAFHDNFPGFSGFGFRRKLARTKTQQGTQTKRANSIFAGFGPAYARINRSGVNFVSNHLSSIIVFIIVILKIP